MYHLFENELDKHLKGLKGYLHVCMYVCIYIVKV